MRNKPHHTQSAMNEETQAYFRARDEKSAEIAQKVTAVIAEKGQAAFLGDYIKAAQDTKHHVVCIEELMCVRPGETRSAQLEDLKKDYLVRLEQVNLDFIRRFGAMIPTDIFVRNFASLAVTPEITPEIIAKMNL